MRQASDDNSMPGNPALHQAAEDVVCPRCAYPLPVAGASYTCPECGNQVVAVAIARPANPIAFSSIAVRFCLPLLGLIPVAALLSTHKLIAQALLIVTCLVVMVNTSIQFMLTLDRPLIGVANEHDPHERGQLERRGNLGKVLLGFGIMALCLMLLATIAGL